MNKFTRLCLASAMAISMTASALAPSVFTPSVFAQGAVSSYTSGVQVANLENSDASIQLTAYNASDGNQAGTHSDTITALGNVTYIQVPGVSNGFNGSLVVSSSKKVAAISNIIHPDFSAGGAYVGLSAGSNSVFLPVLMKGNGAFNTWFSVQNAGTGDATVKVNYTDGTNNTATIKAGAAHVFYQSQETHTQKVFAATVVNTGATPQPLVAAVIEETPAIMFAYTGFADGTTNPVFPIVNSNNIVNGRRIASGLQIQNVGNAATDVTVAYTPAGAPIGAGTACTEKQTIQPGQSNSFALFIFDATATTPTGITSDCNKSAKFVGSAKVTINSAGQKLVGVGNQLTSGLNGEAYGSFDVNAATNKVVMPLIMDRNSGYFTGFSVQNVGTAATTVSCTFTAPSSYTVSKSLQPGEALFDIENNLIANKYVGSGTCSSTDATAKLVGVVNELSLTRAGDQLLVYEAVNSQ